MADGAFRARARLGAPLIDPHRHRPADGPVDPAALDGLATVAWPPDCAQPTLDRVLAAVGVRPEIAHDLPRPPAHLTGSR